MRLDHHLVASNPLLTRSLEEAGSKRGVVWRDVLIAHQGRVFSLRCILPEESRYKEGCKFPSGRRRGKPRWMLWRLAPAAMCKFPGGQCPGKISFVRSTSPVSCRHVSPLSLLAHLARPEEPRPMKRVRRFRQHAKLARLHRQIEVARDPTRPRRIRTRASRYAASLAEALGLLQRPERCEWCRRRQRLERHHWDHHQPLEVIYLCRDCHQLADGPDFQLPHAG